MSVVTPTKVGTKVDSAHRNKSFFLEKEDENFFVNFRSFFHSLVCKKEKASCARTPFCRAAEISHLGGAKANVLSDQSSIDIK